MNSTHSEHTFQRSLIAYCVRGEESPAVLENAEWALYRRMVQVRLRETLEHAFARLQLALGPTAFSRSVYVFLAHADLSTPLLRNVAHAYCDFVTTARAASLALPEWAIELARLEWTELEVAYAADDAETCGELAMHLPLAIAGNVRVLRFAHPVHDLEGAPTTHPQFNPGPAAAATRLCLYRNPVSFDVHTLELNEASARLIELARGAAIPLAQCVQKIVAETGANLDAAWLSAFSEVLADFTMRGIVRGSKPHPAATASDVSEPNE